MRRWAIIVGDPRVTLLDSFLDGGSFKVLTKTADLGVIASYGGHWDHVSVSLPDRCPTWEEMGDVRRIFFEPDAWVMQLHPPGPKKINMHPFCLHLWRPQDRDIPIPPEWMI